MPKHNHFQLQMIAAMVIFGTLAPFIRQVHISSAAIAFLRTMIAAVLLGGILFLHHGYQALQKRQWMPLMLSAIALAGNWIFLFESYRYVSISIATMLYYTAPMLALGISVVLFHEPLTKRQLLCFMMTLIGCICISFQHAQVADMRGILMGLLAAFCYAMILILQRYQAPMPGLQFSFLQMTIAMVLIGGYLLITKDGSIMTLTLSQLPWLLCIGILHTGLAYFLYFNALRQLSLAKSALYSYLDPLTAIIVSIGILQEPCSILQACGIFLIFSAMLLHAQQK